MIEILVPRENVNDESVVILDINFESGSKINKGDIVISIETSKTNIDIDAPMEGILVHQLKKGAEVNVGSLLFSIANLEESQFSLKEQAKVSDINSTTESINSKAKFSIAAIERAKQLGVNLNQFDGGWFTSMDIERHIGVATPMAAYQQPIIEKTAKIESGPVLSASSTKVPISKRKQSEARNLISGDHGNTTSTIGIQIKLLGERYVPPPFLFKGGISDLLVFEAARLLKKYPELNSAYADEKTIMQYDHVNFGWSFDNGKNLKVLAVKHADQISLGELQIQVSRLLDLYDSGDTIPMDLLLDSTVTFSDLSRSAASFMLPLINGHQALILGLVNKSKNLFEIFASFDHRVSEGLSVVSFLTELKSRVLSHFMDANGLVNSSCYACGKSMSEELSLGHRGFIKMTLANGQDESLCRNCFEGW
jgi:pyruvate dehydrogenase E2 component (dihydrolipoamide acetyltransferase)